MSLAINDERKRENMTEILVLSLTKLKNLSGIYKILPIYALINFRFLIIRLFSSFFVLIILTSVRVCMCAYTLYGVSNLNRQFRFENEKREKC